MRMAGPFLREYPSSVTTFTQRRWCYLWLDSEGHVVMIEWI